MTVTESPEEEEEDEEDSSFMSGDACEDVEDGNVSSTKRPLKIVPKKKSKRSRDDEELELLKQLTKIATQPTTHQPLTKAAEPEDVDSLFTKWLLQEIRGIHDERANAYIKIQIQNFMYNFRYGNHNVPQQGFSSLLNSSMSVEQPTYHHM